MKTRVGMKFLTEPIDTQSLPTRMDLTESIFQFWLLCTPTRTNPKPEFVSYYIYYIYYVTYIKIIVFICIYFIIIYYIHQKTYTSVYYYIINLYIIKNFRVQVYYFGLQDGSGLVTNFDFSFCQTRTDRNDFHH